MLSKKNSTNYENYHTHDCYTHCIAITQLVHVIITDWQTEIQFECPLRTQTYNGATLDSCNYDCLCKPQKQKQILSLRKYEIRNINKN